MGLGLGFGLGPLPDLIRFSMDNRAMVKRVNIMSFRFSFIMQTVKKKDKKLTKWTLDEDDKSVKDGLHVRHRHKHKHKKRYA